MFLISHKVQYIPYSLYFLSLDLDPTTVCDLQQAWLNEKALLQILPPVLLSSQTLYMIKTLPVQTSSPTLLVIAVPMTFSRTSHDAPLVSSFTIPTLYRAGQFGYWEPTEEWAGRILLIIHKT